MSAEVAAAPATAMAPATAPAGPQKSSPDASVLIAEEHARSVAEALVAAGCFSVDMNMPRERWCRWKSGIYAPCGCDCRRLNSAPALRRLVDDALTAVVRAHFPEADAVIAVATAGIPWAKTVADRLDLPLAYVRAEPRGPGKGLVECSPKPARRAVLIEDVVAGGGSARHAIEALHAESDVRVTGVASIANWNFPEMRAQLHPWQPLRALTGHVHLVDAARAAGLVDARGRQRLLEFYRDPAGYT